MSWKDACFGFIRKYGSAAKIVAASVLNVVVPGSAALLGLVETACDSAQDTADADWDEQLLEATQRNADELARLGELFDLLCTDLAKLCDKALAFADQPDDLEEIVRKALAGDRTLGAALRKLDALTARFTCLEQQNARLLAGQEEMLPILRRLDRVATFVEDCVAAGVTGRDLAELLRERQEAVRAVHQRRPAPTTALHQRLPRSATVCLLAAGSAVVGHDYPAAERELGRAVLLAPGDAELAQLHKRATVPATQATPRTPPTTATGSTPARFQVGDVLDRWKLEARLGSGGWGSVFKAVRGDEVRALKVMHPEFSADERFAERFRGEVMALAALPRHPNLVRIHGFNKTATGCWYLVMEYLDGPTLEQYLQKHRPLTPVQVRHTFGLTAEGLAQAHAAGLFHRDIKPGNLIFRKSDSRLVLVDFGLAICAEDAGQAKIGGLTLQFAAPEQLRGSSANARSDVYSLAATMYFALLHDQADLRVLFDADHAPEELRSLLAQALHPNPVRRHAHAGELADALRPAVVPVVPPRKPEPPKTESAAEKVRRLRAEVKQLHEDAQALVELYDFEVAAQVLESCNADQIPFLDAALYADVISRRDRLRALDEKIQKRLVPLDPHDPLLPLLLGEYVKLKPNNAEMNDLAKEFPPPEAGKTVLTNKQGMKFAFIPATTTPFWMGSPDSEQDHGSDEKRHRVALTQPFYLGVYPVTVGEFERFVAATNYQTEAEHDGGAAGHVSGNWEQDPSITWRTPGFAQTARHPVVCVSWNDALAMVAWLNTVEANTGLVYSLPTEAQWEYACRAGSETAYFWGNDTKKLGKYAWFHSNSGNKTHPVDTLKPNRWGLWHLTGNIWEWCSDRYGGYPRGEVTDPLGASGGSERVFRGGAWPYEPARCRSAYRGHLDPEGRVACIGFRLAGSVQPS